jgi:hypothetical protein
MATDAVVLVMVRGALAIVVGTARRALAVLHMALAGCVQLGHHLTRILGKQPSLQPEKEAAQDQPFDEEVAHQVAGVVSTLELRLSTGKPEIF